MLLLPVNTLQAQFAEESARAAYDLRMEGEILYAAAMLEKLQMQGKVEGGMVHYEMSRCREHQKMGGAQWVTDQVLQELVQRALKEDPGNLLFLCREAQVQFGKAYMSMMTDSESAADDVKSCTEKLENILEREPDYHELRVQLVEIYAQLPEDLCGDPGKAEAHANYLKETDPWFGMLAGDVMLDESESRVEYWQALQEEHPKDLRVKVKLGLAHLLEGNLEAATPLFEEAMDKDPLYNVLLAQEARYHVYQVMQDREKASRELPLAEKAFRNFLESTPAPPNYLQAWACGHLAMIMQFQGNQEGSREMRQQAKALDGSFSRATGMPGPELYVPPGELVRSGDYMSFTRPF